MNIVRPILVDHKSADQHSSGAHYLFTLRELETEESSGKVASWEFPTALSLFTKEWVRNTDDRTQVVERLRHKYEDHDADMFGTCRHYCD